MKHRLLLLLFLAIGMGMSYGQVIINEISYNPPEGGNDSLEYIELYNAGLVAVDIGGWYFTTGVEDTFPSFMLQPGDYFVTAISAQAMMNVFGIAVHQWSGNALNNNGELIQLVDSGGNLIDEVTFDDVDPWPVEPDGNGPSLELEDPSLDNNDGANWQFSGAGTGVIINGFEVSGTPGSENSGGGTIGPAVTIEAAHVQFTPKNVVVASGAVVRWVNNEPIPHNVNGSHNVYLGNPESFYNGDPAPGPWQFDYTFNVPGLNNYQCDVHAAQGMTGTVSVYDPLSYTDFPLSHLRLTDGMNGSHIFVGVPTRVTGVVHGINFQPSGYSFYVIDQNNVGINVFSFDPGAYVVTEGDMVTVSGVIDAFNGLLEIVPDDIEVISTGNAINIPRVVTQVTELDESSYLFADYLLVDSIGGISPSGFNIYSTSVTDHPILVRVDADAGLGFGPDEIHAGEWFTVWGIGSQFDPDFPFTAGYQILALEGGIIIDGVVLLDRNKISMSPNPAYDVLNLNSEHFISEVEIYSMDGKLLLLELINAQSVNLNVSNLPEGMHIIKAQTDEGLWISKLMIVR